jgi:hypothetical protein
LEWVPAPSVVPWAALAIVVAAATAWVAGGSRAWRLPAALLGVLVGVDVLHAAGLAAIIAGPLPTKLSTAASANALSIVAWVLAGAAVALLLRGRPRGRPLGLFAAMIMLLAGGLFDLAYLNRAILPFGLSATLGRSLVAVTLGLGAGLALGWLFILISPALRPPPSTSPVQAPPGAASPPAGAASTPAPGLIDRS